MANPPLSHLSNSETRQIGFHRYQIFDIVSGSGTPPQLTVNSSTGSGPLYNISLGYSGAGDGLSLMKNGDKLIIGDGFESVGSWYRYDVMAISSQSSSAASATVKYISDSNGNGDTSPTNLHYYYDGYAPTVDINIVARETNQQFLIG